MSEIKDFMDERATLNEIVMEHAGRDIKRFFNLDTNVYRDGALSRKTKELLGLVASTVLRCDDCINYHLLQCCDQGVTSDELEEALAVALIVGGSITIPHLRRAFQAWDELQET